MLATLVASLALVQAAGLPPAPFHRTETFATWGPDPIVIGEDMYLYDEHGLRRYLLPGKLVWTNEKDTTWVEALEVHPKWTIVSRRAEDDKREIVGLNRATGTAEWRMPSKVGTSIVVDGDIMYASLEKGSLTAIDLATRRPVWTAQLGKDEGFEGAVVSGDTLLVATNDNTLYARHKKTGKALWSQPDFYSVGGRIDVAQGVVLLDNDDGVFGLDVATGKSKWKLAEQYISDAAATPSSFVTVSENTLFAIAPATGAKLWTRALPELPEDSSYESPRMFQGGVLLDWGRALTLYNLEGNAVWSASAKQYPGSPLWSDGKTIIVETFGVFAMQSGDYPALPSDPAQRAAAAEGMIADFANLCDAEIVRLGALGDDAFPAVLAGYLRNSAAEDEEHRKDENYHTMTAYEIGHVLREISNAKWAKELEDAYNSLTEKDSAHSLIGQLYAEHGDPASKAAKFITLLKATDPAQWARNDAVGTALDALANSTEPDAVAYMIGVLQDKTLPDWARKQAYINLPRTGGEAGRAAVLAERTKEVAPLASLEERMQLDQVGPKEDRNATATLLGEFTDSRGRTWGLVTSDILGNRNDLWVVEKVEGRWTRPIFSGIATEGSRRSLRQEPGPGLDGKTAAQIASGGWKTVLVGRASLEIDGDGDGLTDVVEARLGTKPDKGDTDGDGRGDAVDAFPTAAPRALTEREQILATAYEAHYRFDSVRGPAILSMDEKTVPCEIPGWNGPVLWHGAGPTMQLQDQWENGIGMIGMRLSEDPRTAEEVRDQIYGVRISTYYGGLNGTGYLFHVRKFGNDWFVIDGRMEYIS